MRYRDRREAGRMLVPRLRYLKAHRPVVLGLPHGGVVVADEIAEALAAPLDALLIGEIVAPRRPRAVIGAVGEHGVVVSNPALVRKLGISPGDFGRAAGHAKAEVARRAATYHPWSSPVAVGGQTVILVADGITTGVTVRAAIRVLRARSAARIVLAVPVAPLDVLRAVSRHVDQTVCPLPLRRRTAVAPWYHDFRDVAEADVLSLLPREHAQP
ncbi:phosphoribosyltransferase family protein [Amycolatopsis sp. NPDC049159]|uniref:phosphoribosyltransferase n=1 Tax=Amycolatopsis sp. NPDC049159 TaxID=3157210 RepID=UPI0033F14091